MHPHIGPTTTHYILKDASAAEIVKGARRSCQKYFGMPTIPLKTSEYSDDIFTF
jgi:hypothetical protein